MKSSFTVVVELFISQTNLWIVEQRFGLRLMQELTILTGIRTKLLAEVSETN
jgi:hypothetical protein